MFTPLFQVQVTQVDIDEGIKGSCTRCPVARALARETLLCVHVARRKIIVDTGVTLDFDLSPATRTWINGFDAHHGPMPLPFTAVFGVEK